MASRNVLPLDTDLSLHRSRLDQLLEEALSHRLVFLSAGSGYGKTRAASSYLSQRQARVAWFHLTRLDNYPARFWSHFLKALHPCGEALYSRISKLSFPSSYSALSRFLEQFAVEVRELDGLVLAFDEFQLLEDGQVKDFIRCLAEAQLDNVSIILIGAEVALPLSSTIHPARLTERQLRFTGEEISAYYSALGIRLTPRQLERIVQITEGWALAVSLLGLHLQKNTALVDESIDEGVTLLLELMDRYLFTPLDPAQKQALLLLSLVEEFSLEMAMKLTSLGAEALLSLVNGNALISFRPEQSSYYFHSLFRLFLEQRQITLRPRARQAFLLGAAQWYEGQKRFPEACGLYRDCGNPEGVYRIALELCRRPRGDASAVLPALYGVPEEFLAGHPLLVPARAYLAIYSGDWSRAAGDLEAWKLRWIREPATPESRTALGESCILLALLSMRRGDYAFLGLLETASGCLPEGTTLLTGPQPALQGNGNAMIFTVPQEGELEKMTGALFQAIPRIRKLLHGVGAGRDHLAAAEAAYYTGNLKEAQAQAAQAIPTAAEWGQWDTVCNSHYLLMRIHMARGKLRDMEESLSKLRLYADRLEGDDSFDLPDVAESGFLLKMDLPDRIPRWITDDSLVPSSPFPANNGRELVMKAGYLVAVRRYYDALTFIDAGIRRCDGAGQWFSRLKLLVLKSLVYGFLEEYGVAARHLEEAYALSHANCIIMPYVEYGSNMRNLLGHLKKVPGLSIPGDWIDSISVKANTYAKYFSAMAKEYRAGRGASTPPGASLTLREQEVLRLLCQGLSNEAIGERLDMSSNAVKSALKRIYAKINATNRADAVRMALQDGFWA